MIDQLSDLSPQGRAELFALLTQMGDLLYVLGSNLAERGASGPTLEGSSGAVALAQLSLGHARQLYRTAALVEGQSTADIGDDLPDVAHRVTVGFLRTPLTNWVDLMGGLLTVNLAMQVVLQELVKHPALSLQLAKTLAEQTEALWFAGGWVESLRGAEAPIAQRMQERLTVMSDAMANWLDGLVLPTPVDLGAQFVYALSEAL